MANGNDTPNAKAAPDVLDGLSQLWGNLPNPNAPPAPLSPTMQPGYPGGPPIMSGVTGGTRIAPVPYAPNTVPTMAPTTALPPAAAAPKQPIPLATDDPEMAAARGRFRTTSDAYNKMLQQQMDLSGKISAVPQVDPGQHHSSIGRTLLGIALSTMAGAGSRNPEFESKIADEVINQPLHSAQAARERTLAPFLAQQNAVERQVPLLNAANESAWREYQAGNEAQKEKLAERKQTETEKKDTAYEDLKSEYNDIASKFHDGTLQERDARRLDQIHAEGDKVENAQKRLELQSKIADLQDQVRQQNAQTNAQRVATGATAESDRAAQAEINQKQRPVLSEIRVMENRLILDPGDKDAQTKLDAAHSKLDSIENDVRSRRAPPAAAPAASGKPAANAPAGGPPATLWKGKEGKVLTLKDAQGNQSRWQLENGKPVQVQEKGATK